MELLSAIISTITTLLVFISGLAYEKRKQNKNFINQFFAEIDINKLNLKKVISQNKLNLDGRSEIEIQDNNLTIDNETKVFITPMLDDAVMEIIKNNVKLTIPQKEILEYYSLTKRYNWLVDRIKNFRIRLNALLELITIAEEIEQKIESIKRQNL